MKNKLFKLLFAIVCLLSTTGMYAQDFEMNGIYYNIFPDNKSVQVSCYGDGYSRVPDEYKYKGSVVIPEMVNYRGVTYSVTSIGEDAFKYCEGLTSITIPESVTSIGNRAFLGFTGLTSITIPESVTSIGVVAFSGCSNIIKIVVEQGNGVYDSRENCNAIIETVSNSLIAGCKNTVIPNSVTTIGKFAFYGCEGLTSITIPESVTSIGDGAFSRCTGLTSITIPNSVTSIGFSVFSDCSNIIKIVVEQGNGVYDSRENCNAIIETASNSLIAGCKNTVIPNSVTSIGFQAFEGCTGLTSITIPESVTSIESWAFPNCSGLTEITVEAAMPPTIYNYTFVRVDKSIPLYVPAGCVEAYRAAEYWSEFTNIVEMNF